MLTTAQHLGEPVAGYEAADHPVQKRARKTLSEFGDTDLSGQAVGTDGCGIPTIAMPLTALARAFARLGSDPGEACTCIRAAMAANPHLIGGSDRFDTKITTALGDKVVIKCGAEAVHAAAIPALGLGISVKIDDGGRRAAEVAIAALLRYLKVVNDAAWTTLAPIAQPTIFNTTGAPVGEIRAASGWLPARDRT